MGVKKSGTGVKIAAGAAALLLAAGGIDFLQLSKDTMQKISALPQGFVDMAQVKNGTYSGTVDGGAVQVAVTVTVDNHKITSIAVDKHQNGMGKAGEAVVQSVLQKNSTDLPPVAGATASSKAFLSAVYQALRKGLAG